MDTHAAQPPSGVPLGPEADPGFLRELGNGRPLGTLRGISLSMLFSVLFLVAVLGAVHGPVFDWSPAGLAVPAVAGLLAVTAAVWLPRVAPIEPARTPQGTARKAVARFESATMVRLALCQVATLFGMISSFAFEPSLAPVLLGAAISLVAMPLLALPTRARIEEFRVRLERNGDHSYLWNGLVHKGRKR
ncbi:hypothetical protein [Marinactinospora rubrisoli]|uniref:Integral membrane protein n=1 Tax=Marinactinospora rubrisoli TaxID=2715399 RepID=A0ABW2KDD1_9ACTN